MACVLCWLRQIKASKQTVEEVLDDIEHLADTSLPEVVTRGI